MKIKIIELRSLWLSEAGQHFLECVDRRKPISEEFLSLYIKLHEKQMQDLGDVNYKTPPFPSRI